MTSVQNVPGLKRAALVTGLAYAGLAVTGMLGYLAFRAQLYVPGDATVTAENLVSQQGLARVGVAVDLAAVLTQAVAALWFYQLFRTVRPFAAGAITAFGLVNSVIMLIGAAFSATALSVALGDAAATTHDRAATALLMYDLSAAVWRVGAVFFGLWLIPMGWCAMRSTFAPHLLGWTLMVGGVGYVLSAFVDVLTTNASTLVSALTVPATIGEFWMVGYLLLTGLRRQPARQPTRTDRQAAATV